MPHVAITMYPGRDRRIKAALAEKVQKCVAEELGVDKKVVSVSIEDVEKRAYSNNCVTGQISVQIYNSNLPP